MKQQEYQDAVRPEMMAELAAQINVRPEILYRLGIGWVDEVKFSDGAINTTGWWTIPERDTRGKIIGTALRSREEKKAMMLKSSRGFIYAVDEGYDPTQIVYRHGSHNWLRVKEEGMDCPLCGHPDGCMVSAENPEDPQAIICVTTKSDTRSGTGWLHRLKPEAFIHATNQPLAKSDWPVVIVEGFTDVATAMDQGFVGVGRPSASSGTKRSGPLLDLVRGRKVIIVGDNDPAGVTGMNQTFEALHKSVHTTKILPPSDVKDLRKWRERYHITAEELLTYARRDGSQERDPDIFESLSCEMIAERFLYENYLQEGAIRLRKQRGQWYEYDGRRYRVVHQDDEVRKAMYKYLSGKKVVGVGSSVQALHLTKKFVGDIIDGTYKFCPIAEEPPAWINGMEGPDPSRLISFQNGLLDVGEFMEGRVRLMEPTPHYFALSCLPFDFDEDAQCKLWQHIRETSLLPLAIRTVQEWYGYCMTPDCRFEKIAVFYGPARAGKGLCATALEAVVGEENTAATDLKSLGERFGRQDLVGKLLAVMGESRTSLSMDTAHALDTLLTISGRDKVRVEVKHHEATHRRLTCRFTLLLNTIPALPDYAEALMSRLVIVPFNRSFVGDEDESLKDRLADEAPGIAMWALEGARRLYKNRRFTDPEGTEEIKSQFRKVMSPINSFLDDCCKVHKLNSVNRLELYDCWIGWSREKRMAGCVRSRFEERLRVVPNVQIEDDLVRGLKLNDRADHYLRSQF